MQQSFDKHVYRVLLALTVATLGVGTVVYHFVEHFKWVDSYYFSVVTLATVGYGDYVPHTTFGKIFTTFYIFIGVGIITTFITYTVKRRASKMHYTPQGQPEKKKND
jgi:voltage-gated potassium channel